MKNMFLYSSVVLWRESQGATGFWLEDQHGFLALPLDFEEKNLSSVFLFLKRE